LQLLGLGLALWVTTQVPRLRAEMRGRAAAQEPLAVPARQLAVAAPAAAPIRPAVPPVAAPATRFITKWRVIYVAVPAAGPATPGSEPAAIPPQPAVLPAAPGGEPVATPKKPEIAAADGLATQAYARLAAGDRRAAAGLFDAALAAGPDPRAATWATERARLTRRWSGEAYSLSRDPGPAGPAATPVLGGGQSGASLAWQIDPLARRPLALVGRASAASAANGGIDPASLQTAVGVRWQIVPGFSLSAERLIAVGANARNDWTLRAAGGMSGKHGRAEWSGYGEAGVLTAGDVYAGGQARLTLRLMERTVRRGSGKFSAGAGTWASIQRDPGGFSLGRFDIGPTAVAQVTLGRFNLDVAADWRFRMAGNAAPGSGPALTVSTRF
jgi:hypothetical protein